jgi:PAS domain S-box-containing protein
MHMESTTPRFPALRTVRTRLLLLGAWVVVPLIGLAVYRAVERRAAEEARLGNLARELAVVAAQALETRVRDASTLLLAVSRVVDPRATAEENDARLRSLAAEASLPYSNIWIVDPTGRNIGAVRLPPAGRAAVWIGDRRYFRDAVRLRSFQVGDIVRSRVVPGAPWVLPFGRPLVDRVTGRVLAVVGASVELDSLDALRIAERLPAGSVLTVIDSTGRVLLRSVDPERWVGRTLAEITGVAQSVPEADEGFDPRRRRSADGTDRLVGFRRAAATGWMVYVGIPARATFDAVAAQFWRDIAFAGLIAIGVVGVGSMLSLRIVRPIESLTADARAFAAGDHARRSNVAQADELGDLARAFNTMAEAATQREAALADSEQRYRLLFEANPLPIFAWSPVDGRLVGVNDAACDYYGYDRTTFLSRTIRSLLDPSELPRFEERAMTAMPTGPRHCGIWKHRHADGRLLELEVLAAPYEQDDGLHIVNVAIDVTARQAAERALQESREMLRQAQKMEALGSFAGGMAHDFNNYLSSIVGYAELLGTQLAPDAPGQADVREVLAAARRASDLTRQILVFSRKQVVEPQLLAIGDVVRGIEGMLARLMGEAITVVTSLPEQVGIVRADQGQLEQVLVNLAANARDAMPDGGTFVLATAAVEVMAPDPSHPGVPSGHYTLLTASDTGSGIPPEVRAKIFDPFFTTKARGHGTGLGLSMVYGIVQQAGGTIRVESAVGAGTAFFVYLPTVLGAVAARTTPATARSANAGGRGERILLVEDDDAVRAVAQQMLLRHGYTVEVAIDGGAALARLRGAPRPDLLLTDVVMPRMHGRELADRAQALHPGLRVLFMSGYADDEVLVRGVATDGIAFLPKPFATAELLAKVRAVLDTAPPALPATALSATD